MYSRKNIVKMAFPILMIFASLQVQAANSTIVLVTRDNIDEVFSYEKVSEQAVRTKAKEILATGILTKSNLNNQGWRSVYDALESRILDNWRYLSTRISWYKVAHDIDKNSTEVGMSRLPIWKPWSLDSHFSFALQPEGVIRNYVSRHIAVQIPFMNRIKA